MKYIIILVIIGVTILSCSKNDDNPNINLIGNWNWQRSSGGIAGTTETPQTMGQNRKLEISTDSIKSYRNGNLNFKTRYTIDIRESGVFNEPREMIIQENGFRQIISLSGNNLILIGDCNDCFVDEYIKE